MNKTLKSQLHQLQEQVVTMAHAVNQSLDASVAALVDASESAASIVITGDTAVNEQRFSIESDVVTVIATQQPVAGDARLLIGILEIATELERMADYAKDIARITIRQAKHGAPELPVGLVRMADLAISMLEQAIRAFVDSDSQLATKVAEVDEEIDTLCRTLHLQLLENVSANEVDFEEAVRLLPVVHNVERFADRATNICERVVYLSTGEQVEFDN